MSVIELHDEIRACKLENKRLGLKLARLSRIVSSTKDVFLAKMKADIELCIQVEINRDMIRRLDTATSFTLKSFLRYCDLQRKFVLDLSSKMEELNEKIATLSASGN